MIKYSTNTILLIFIIIIIIYIFTTNNNVINSNSNTSQVKNEKFADVDLSKIFIESSRNKCNRSYKDLNSLTNINTYDNDYFNKLIKEANSKIEPKCSNDITNNYCELNNDNNIKLTKEQELQLEQFKNDYLEHIKTQLPNFYNSKSWTFEELFLKEFNNLLDLNEQKIKMNIDINFLKKFFFNRNNSGNNGNNNGNNTIKTERGITRNDLYKYNRLRRARNKFF